MIVVTEEKTAINRNQLLNIMPQIWYNNEAIVGTEELENEICNKKLVIS